MLPFPLLGRFRSWAVLGLLILLALCASPAAQAQGTQTDTYTVTYKDGATTAIGSTDFPTGPYTPASAPNQHVPAGNAYGGSASNHQNLLRQLGHRQLQGSRHGDLHLERRTEQRPRARCRLGDRRRTGQRRL